MSQQIKTIISIWLTLLIIFHSTAQKNKDANFELGASLGTLIYMGDQTPSTLGYLKSPKISIGLSLSHPVSTHLSVRGNLNLGNVSADESRYSNPSWRQQRNFLFTSSVTELTVQGLYNFQGANNEYNHSQIQTYVFGGAGFTFLKIKRDFARLNRSFFDSKSNTITGISLDSAHSLPKVITVVPVGVGLKFILSRSIALNTEFCYRILSTDFLDGFKYSANPKKPDSYYSLVLGVIYTPIQNKYRCPKPAR